MLFWTRARSASVAACGLCSAVAGAQTATQSLEPVVITASRVEQRLMEVLPHTSVVTRTDIERAQAPDVLSLIARAAGIEIAQLGGVGTQSGLFVRGGETRQVLVLIDGVPLNNLNFSTASLDQMTVGQIDRIEIVRGNVSSLYGAQAVGGVIHVFTRSGARAEPGQGANARVAGGSRGTSQLSGAVDGATERWHYALAASRYETEGQTAIDPRKRPVANPDRDGYDNRSATAGVGFRIAEGHEISLRGFQSRGHVRYDSEFGPPTQTDASEQTIASGSVSLRNALAANWRSQLTASKLRDALDARVTAFPYFVTSRSANYGWQNDVTVAPGWIATAAIEQLHQDIDSNTAYVRTERTVDALRAGLAGRSGVHQVQLNVRHDKHSDFGAADTYYAGYGVSFTEALRVFASASTAFNAPTFNDLFFPFGGNPLLKPEKARSAELGAQFVVPALSVRAAIFSTRTRDLIGSDASFNRVNIGRASVEGAELSVETFMHTVRVVASLTAQDARDDVNDARLVRRARAFGNLQLSRAFGPIGVEANWRVTGDRLDRVSGQRRILGGYGVVDLAARWRVDRVWAATLRVSNLADREYENAFGYPGASRAVLVGVEARL